MKIHLLKVTILCCCLPFFSNAQSFQDLPIPFTINGEIRLNAMAGGHNNPQFSEVDLNADGLMDLYIFDRDGSVGIPYLQVVENGVSRYQYAEALRNNFPELKDFVLLRDYNNDGAMDIFSAYVSGFYGFKVFRGYFDDGELKFDLVTFDTDFFVNDVLLFHHPDGTAAQIEIPSANYPVVDDIDNDGDLDILNIIEWGSVTYYRNMDVENGMDLDSLHFVLEDECWGGFRDELATYMLSDTPGECVEEQPNAGGNDPHNGNVALLTFDEDNDLDKEIVIGQGDNLVRLHNAGTVDEAWCNASDTDFPTYNESVDIRTPAAFYLDVDFDGNKDLLAAGNDEERYNVFLTSKFYKNTANNENPVFEFQQNDFLQETMLDFGKNAYPAIADVTGDGLLDIVVGNQGQIFPDNTDDGARLFLLKNTGTATQPAFELTDDNWLNFDQFSLESGNFQPTFGDLDGDGDLDLLVGEQGGSLFYAENTAETGNSMAFPTIVPDWQQINIGQISSPAIGDVNQDGLPDLVIGERNKFLNYFPNQGTATTPLFESNPLNAPNSAFFGEIITTEDVNAITAYSTPILVPFENKFRLFFGNESGNIWQYDDIGGDVTGVFEQTSNFVGAIDEGSLTAIAAADLNNDGLLDFVIGNARGGLRIVESDILDNPVSTVAQATNFQVDLFPNPANDKVVLSLKNTNNHPVSCTIYNAVGVAFSTQQFNNRTNEINVKNLPSGVYFCEIIVGKQRIVERLVKW